MTEYDVTVSVTYRVRQPNIREAMTRAQQLSLHNAAMNLSAEGAQFHEVTKAVKR